MCPAKARRWAGKKTFKLSSNETPLGPSLKAKEAFLKAVERLEDYPDGASELLRKAIGARYGLDPARIVLRQRFGRYSAPDLHRLPRPR